jgi:hypothetical protein
MTRRRPHPINIILDDQPRNEDSALSHLGALAGLVYGAGGPSGLPTAPGALEAVERGIEAELEGRGDCFCDPSQGDYCDNCEPPNGDDLGL